ncbi:MAG: hypothetical protein HY459_00780 [Parcubacteria group bacterium]|nr:hypothetical protein [Parcubacteria group bacterium]
MHEKKLELAVKLMVRQGDGVYTIPTDQVPVISWDDFAEVVNFLRCGCPAVQIVIRASNEYESADYREEVCKFLEIVAIGDEKFEVGQQAMAGEGKYISKVTRSGS